MKQNKDIYRERNILSCVNGTVFTGKEIKNWINWHANHNTSKTKIAKRLLKYNDIDDTTLYTIEKGQYKSSNSYNKFVIVRYSYIK